jgi:5-methylcytosine-specific restriction endonuclease McrA
MSERDYKPMACAICTKPFKPYYSRSRYCGKECQAIGKKATDKTANRRVSYVHCKNCGTESYRKKYGGNDPLEFCGRPCAFAHKGMMAREVNAIRRIYALNTGYERRKQSRAMALANAIKRQADRAIRSEANKAELASRPCKQCGKPVGYTFGRGKVYCSKLCLKTANKGKPKSENEKAARKRRKLIQRGAKVGLPFTHKEVFDRAGWKCQLCGVPTPERLRGTYKPNAPELDHCRPLAKGGEHSIDNAQLLCRSCNSWKSDRLIPAQAGLFTSLMW